MNGHRYIRREAATGGEGLIQKGLFALALLAIFAFLPRFIKQYRHAFQKNMMAITDLKQCLDDSDDVLLLDVCTDEDYIGEQGHIDGSVLIPVEQLE